MEKFYFKLDTGYVISEKREDVSIEKAVEILTSKKQCRYTKAERRGDRAILTKHVVVCHRCSHEVPAYERFTPYITGKATLPCGTCNRIKNSEIREWGTSQLSLIDSEEKTLALNSPLKYFIGRFYCPVCKESSPPSRTARDVSVTYNKKRIQIRAEVIDVLETISIPALSYGRVSVGLPLYEEVTFNTAKGTTDAKIVSRDGKVIEARDVTRRPGILVGAVRIALTYNNVARVVKDMFKRATGMSVTDGKTIDIEKLILFTQFSGFDEKFYDAIPYEPSSGFVIEEGFRKRAKRLSNQKTAIRCLDGSSLPKAKSVRRLFFKNPALLFYLEESEMLFHALRDVNIFCKMLNSRLSYQLLSMLHYHPGIILFIKDFCEAKCAAELWRMIDDDRTSFEKYAIHYISASDSIRKKEKKRWKDGLAFHFECDYKKASVPCIVPDGIIPDCNIDGFDFVWLRNTRDFAIAAADLNNCLSNFDAISTIVGVKIHGEFVAAIELIGDMISQARAAENESLYTVAGLHEAYEKWTEKFMLDRSSSELFCFGDDLPF